MGTLEELQIRITRLEDIKQIERLQKIYGYYQDYGKWLEIVDLFTDNEPSVEEADRGVYKGKDSVRRYYIDLLGGGPNHKPLPGWLSILMQLQGIVTVAPDGNTAHGRWYGMGMEAKPIASLHEGELRQTWINGTYENEYIKEDDKWKFKKLHFYLTFRTPYEDGWLKVPVVGQNGPDNVIKPDAQTTVYAPYPSSYQVPFHYKHPITGKWLNLIKPK
jgi:hypothetical protein